MMAKKTPLEEEVTVRVFSGDIFSSRVIVSRSKVLKNDNSEVSA